jgi:hypothetical protein
VLNGLLTDEQVRELLILASEVYTDFSEAQILMGHLLTVALARMGNPGGLEEANRFRHVAQLAEVVTRAGTTYGYREEIRELVQVLLAFG